MTSGMALMLRRKFERQVNRMWYQGRWPGCLLLPLAWIYGACVKYASLRRRDYARSPTTPVAVIGNLTVGGAGKTPLLIHLARQLRERGVRPGVVSRGYGGRGAAFPHRVAGADEARVVGDEALLIHEKTGCPVVVDPDRARGVEYLVSECGVDVVLSDDGLQHHRMRRDMEIVVVDGERGFGNGMLLPAGPLRASQEGLNRASFILHNGGEAAHFELTLTGFVNLQTRETLAPRGFAGKSVHACAGIARPEAFFRMLEGVGAQLTRHALPDHAPYTPQTLRFKPEQPVIVTEKDMVKCRSFAGEQVWAAETAVRMHPEIERIILDRLAKLSARSSEAGDAKTGF